MSKKKKDKTTNIVNQISTSNFSAEQMQHIIALAIVEADEIKAEKEQAKQDNVTKKSNLFARIWKLLTISKKEVTGDSASTNLIRSSMYVFWAAIEYFLYIFSAILIVSIFASCFAESINNLQWYGYIFISFYAIISFLFARIFRIVKFEFEKIEDKNYLLGLFAAVTALISAIAAIISLFG